jgi:hypothetical protein
MLGNAQLKMPNMRLWRANGPEFSIRISNALSRHPQNSTNFSFGFVFMPKASKKMLSSLQAKTPSNLNQLMARYCALMQEIKDRTNAIRLAAGGQLPVHPRIAVELSYLQLRMVCELIALASVMAHGDLGVVLSAKIRDEDRPGALLKLLEKIHPDCYPHPIRQILNDAGEVGSIDDIHTGFLKRDELPRLYGLCGNELHQGKLEKIGRFPEPEKSYTVILSWYEKILRLLGNHRIKIYNSPDAEIWVGMEEKNTKQVFWSFMVSVPAASL